jgi:hypothetical protein
VLTGTVLQGTRVPVRTWAAVLATWPRAGVPTARALADDHGITPEAARHLIRRVDAALTAVDVGADTPLPAVFRVPAGEAAHIRARTPARLRPRRQVGPSADYGG